MSYSTNPELLRNAFNRKWIINLPCSKYTNLATFIKIKYYFFWFLGKLDFYIISYKNLEINNRFTAFIYYYGERTKRLILDKFYKGLLEIDIGVIYSTRFSINLFNIINFLPEKVHALNRRLKTYIKTYTKKNRNNKFEWIKDLMFIINICTYSPNTKLMGSFLIKTLCSLRKQWVFIKIAFNMIKKVLPYRSKKIRGMRVAIAGKINGRNRKKTVIKNFGRLSTQKLAENIKYSLSTSDNIYGAFSIKVWIVSLQNK